MLLSLPLLINLLSSSLSTVSARLPPDTFSSLNSVLHPLRRPPAAFRETGEVVALGSHAHSRPRLLAIKCADVELMVRGEQNIKKNAVGPKLLRVLMSALHRILASGT